MENTSSKRKRSLILLLVIPIIALAALLSYEVLKPFQTIEIQNVSTTCVEGSPIQISVTIKNNSIFSRERSPLITVDNKAIDSEKLALKSSETSTFQITLPAQSAGSHMLSFENEVKEIRVLEKATFIVMSYKIISDSVIATEPFSITAKIHNDGEVEGLYSSSYISNDVQVGSIQVQLMPGETKEVTTNVVINKSGEQEIKLDNITDTINVKQPATFEIVSFNISKKKARPGEDVYAEIRVVNSGDIPGKFAAPLYVNGQKLNWNDNNIFPHSGDNLRAKIPHPSAGEYKVEFGNYVETFITYELPANCSISDLSISNQFPNINQSVNAVVKVTNKGDKPGKLNVTIKINDKIYQTKSITVSGDSTEILNFTIKQTKKGSYIVAAGKLRKTIYVNIASRPANGTFFVKTAKGGLNEMTFGNDCSDVDAYYVLAKKQRPKTIVLSVYVRAKSRVHINIKDGDYIMYVVVGNKFDIKAKTFLLAPFYGKCINEYSFSSVDVRSFFGYYWYTDRGFYLDIDKYSQFGNKYNELRAVKASEIPK